MSIYKGYAGDTKKLRNVKWIGNASWWEAIDEALNRSSAEREQIVRSIMYNGHVSRTVAEKIADKYWL